MFFIEKLQIKPQTHSSKAKYLDNNLITSTLTTDLNRVFDTVDAKFELLLFITYWTDKHQYCQIDIVNLHFSLTRYHPRREMFLSPHENKKHNTVD